MHTEIEGVDINRVLKNLNSGLLARLGFKRWKVKVVTPADFNPETQELLSERPDLMHGASFFPPKK